MKKELCIKQIYDDFNNKTILSEQEKEVLDLFIKDYSLLKIADETKQGTATVSRIIDDLKEKSNNYKKLEIEKLKILDKKTI
ncbi:MAG: hypothetical protein IKR57_01640 [Bacilli bacterium]|nr:hypothetical protein [Bacilli bacterium]